MRILSLVIAALLLAAGPASAGNVGFEQVSVPVAGDRPLAMGIWYPTDAPEAVSAIGLNQQSVATGAAVAGRRHPLVVISHGTGGSLVDHYDTAHALAEAGFIVAAVSHTGDTYDDRSRALRIVERPAQLVRAVDYLVGEWPERAAVDASRVGVFGFSSGGFTALAALGGEPDLSLIAPHCVDHPAYFDCALQKQLAGQSVLVAKPAHDPRLRAAVVAAPALGFTFTATGLSKVRAPIQLWRAGDDHILPHPDYAEAVRAALPRAADYRVVPGADHFDFMAPCGPALAKAAPAICQRDSFDRAAFHRTFNAEVVAFFKRTLGAP